MTIQVTRSSMPPFEEYMNEIKDLWDSRWLTNMGAKHKLLEEQLKQYLNTPYISLFTNGHLALESIIEAFQLTGEVITTPFTFASTTHAIARKGLKPVFCDIKPDDLTLNADQLEELITEKTSAIVPVHVYGNICDVDSIDQIAKQYNLKVIYDAAHAFGVTLNGIGAANFGDASMFSFHATKVFHTIEGGAVTFHDASLIRSLNNLKNFGITGYETIECIGGNAKMNEFQAAMGICNLRHIEEEIKKRKVLTEYYYEKLSDVKGIRIIKPKNEVKYNYSYFPVVFDGYKYTRDEIFDKLKADNINARKYFYPITNSFDCYKSCKGNETPVAKYISERILTLPLYSDLQINEVERICNIILK